MTCPFCCRRPRKNPWIQLEPEDSVYSRVIPGLAFMRTAASTSGSGVPTLKDLPSVPVNCRACGPQYSPGAEARLRPCGMDSLEKSVAFPLTSAQECIASTFTCFTVTILSRRRRTSWAIPRFLKGPRQISKCVPVTRTVLRQTRNHKGNAIVHTNRGKNPITTAASHCH